MLAPLPLVTVIVPTRGRPELLSRALRTILAQRYEGAIECLVVLDGPEDDAQAATVEAVQRLRPPAGTGRTVAIIRNSRRHGLAGARNTGIAAARGALVAFCDDDDEWLPDKLAEQVPRLLVDGAVSLVGCGIEVCYRGRRVTRVPAAPTVGFGELLRSRRTDLHPSTFVARREDVTGAIGLVDEEIPGSYAEDYDWLLRAARQGSIATVQRPLARIHWHASSFFEGRWETIVPALQYLVAKHPEFRGEPRGLARIYGQIAFAHAAAGRPARARRWTARALRLDWRQPRPYLALLVSVGILRPSLLLAVLHHFGRGM